MRRIQQWPVVFPHKRPVVCGEISYREESTDEEEFGLEEPATHIVDCLLHSECGHTEFGVLVIAVIWNTRNTIIYRADTIDFIINISWTTIFTSRLEQNCCCFTNDIFDYISYNFPLLGWSNLEKCQENPSCSPLGVEVITTKQSKT